jgi:hypothetical protein
MAFFSVALTLNLTGVRLNEVHASALKPQNLRRSFFALEASAVRSYDNLRMVHVLESRVDALREDDALRAQQEQEQEQQRRSAPTPDGQPLQQNRNQLPELMPAGGTQLQHVSYQTTSPTSIRLPEATPAVTKDLS